MKTTDATPSLNGQAPEAKPKRSRKKKPTRIVDPAPKASPPVEEKKKIGRRGSSVAKESVRYLVSPWVPFAELTLVAGQPQTGKSSFASWLVNLAGCAALLPGFEESVATCCLPRMRHNGVNVDHLLLLDDREYRLPRDKALIKEGLVDWGANLLIIDPIDSYMEDGMSENDGQAVRLFLESCAWIAKEADVAVIGIRHPGKDPRNIMPGSRAWRAVPNSVLHLVMDASRPPKRYLIHDKDKHGNDALPHRYTLEGVPGLPRLFKLAGEMAADNVSLGREVQDVTERVDVRRAGMYARRLFESTPEPLVSDWKNECLANGVSDRARRLAYSLLGIEEKPGSVGGKWIMFRTAKDWPSWTDQAEIKK